MKTIKIILGFAFIVATAMHCKNNTSPEIKTIDVASESVKKELDPNATYAKAEFTVEGMTCAVGCAATIQKKIAHMEGVTFAKVDFENKLAMVEYDIAKVNTASIESTVTRIADIYKVSHMKDVEAFSTETTAPEKKACEPGCKKSCCTAHVTPHKKMDCKPGCKEACCVKKDA